MSSMYNAIQLIEYGGLLGQVTDLITTLNRRTTAIAERKAGRSHVSMI